MVKTTMKGIPSANSNNPITPALEAVLRWKTPILLMHLNISGVVSLFRPATSEYIGWDFPSAILSVFQTVNLSVMINGGQIIDTDYRPRPQTSTLTVDRPFFDPFSTVAVDRSTLFVHEPQGRCLLIDTCSSVDV